VNKKHFENKYGFSIEEVYGQVLVKHINDNTIISTDEAVFLSRKGRFIGNEIFQSFLMD